MTTDAELVQAFIESFGQAVVDAVVAKYGERLTPPKEWYTIRELATAIKRSPRTIRDKWCQRGRIECERQGRDWLIPRHEYERLVAGGRPRKAA